MGSEVESNWLLGGTTQLMRERANWSEARPLDADITQYYSLKIDIAPML